MAGNSDCLRLGANFGVGDGVKFVGKCKIQLDGCARKADCAKNFELGFLQNGIHQERLSEHEHRRIVARAKGEVVNGKAPNIPLGLRDAESKDSVFVDEKCRRFTGDGTEQTTEFFDNPGLSRAIEDEDVGKLKTARMDIRFQAWLAVRNVAWYAVNRDESMIFICNFEWGTQGDWRWDGKQLWHHKSQIVVGKSNPGKGSVKPIFDGPVANDQIKNKTLHERGYWYRLTREEDEKTRKIAPVASTKLKSYGTF
jgi:hypothetical protein